MKIYLFIILFIIQFSFSESTFNSLEFSSNAACHSLHNGAIASSSKYLSINPASISIEKTQLEISQLLLPADIKNSNFSLMWLQKKNIFYIRINTINYGTLRDDFDNIEFKAKDLSIELGRKSKYKNLFSIGYSIGFIKSSIYKYYATGFYNNFGLRMNIFNERLSIGATLNHAGFQTKSFIHSSEFLPTSFRYGVAFTPLYLPVNIYFDFINYLNYKNKKFQIGLNFKKKDKINFRLSTVNTRDDLNTKQYYKDIFNNFSFGFGFFINNKNINISVQNIGPAGIIYGFSILI